MGLKAKRQCMQIRANGGRSCYKGLKVWKNSLTKLGCPNLDDTNEGVLSKAACWCGEDTQSSDLLLDAPVPINSSDYSENDAPQVAASESGGACYNKHDGGVLKKKGKAGVSNAMKFCSEPLSNMLHPPKQGSI